MNKLYLPTFAIFIQAILVIIAVALSFTIVGSPEEAKNIKSDVDRLTALQRIHGSINSYVSENSTLPNNLDDLELKMIEKQDPETKQPLEYKPTGTFTYQLCATFKTSSEKIAETQYSYFVEADEIKFNEGYQCLDYEVEKYIQNLNNSTVFSSPSVVITNSPETAEIRELTGTLVAFVPHNEPNLSSELLSVESIENGITSTKNFRFPSNGVRNILGETMMAYEIKVGDTLKIRYTLPPDGIYQAIEAHNLSR